MADIRQARANTKMVDEKGLHRLLDTTVLLAVTLGVFMIVATG